MIPHHVMQSIEWAVNLWNTYGFTVVQDTEERDRGNGWTHGTLTITEKQAFENPFPRRREFQISWNESGLVEFEAGDDCWTDIDFLPLYLLLKAEEKGKADAVTIASLEVERARERAQHRVLTEEIRTTAARFRKLAKENRELRRRYLASEIAGRRGDEHKYEARAELYDREAEALEKLLPEAP